MLERTISMPQWTTSQNSGEAEMVFNTAKSFHVIQWLSACIQPKGDSAKYHCAWLALFCFVCLIAWTWDMMAQKTFCASARLQQLQPSRNHRIIRTLRANRVGYRSWSSLSLCFTTTIHKSKDLPPKSQDPRAIIETSQRMCIQASKSRDSVGVSGFLSNIHPHPSRHRPRHRPRPVQLKTSNTSTSINKSQGRLERIQATNHPIHLGILHLDPWGSEPIMKSWSLLIGRFPSLLHTFSAWIFFAVVFTKTTTAAQRPMAAHSLPDRVWGGAKQSKEIGNKSKIPKVFTSFYTHSSSYVLWFIYGCFLKWWYPKNDHF